jgi:nitroreductase
VTTQASLAGVPMIDPPTMALDDAIRGRRSVREYAPAPVDEATIRALIDAAVHAPSATNAQSWTFTVVRDQALLDRLSERAKAHLLANLPPNLQHNRYRSQLGDPGFHIFYHAPALIVISAIAPGPWAIENCALAAENLMLAAYGRGLGACWIGFAQQYLGTEAGKGLLGLASACLPVAPIIVGHPSAFPPATQRREPEIRWVG